MSIHATLHTAPTSRLVHEMIYITRGASAELVYPLYNKVFSFKDIEQLTVTFKQGKTFSWFTMIEKDTEGKDVKLDSHFYHLDSTEYDAIIFNLDATETKQFKAGTLVEYEIAIKLNTDSFAACGGNDSTIIEPQHPIQVVDSLFSYIEES